MATKTAVDWMSDLYRGTKQAFPNINRAEVLAGLKERLGNPSAIDQNPSSLCGAASLMYSTISTRPELYARYVVELYQEGRTQVGSMEIKPGNDCKRYKAVAGRGMHPTDWVALASIRDSENDFFDYDSPSCEAGGITLPGDLGDWFKAFGFKHDANQTNLVFTKGVDTLLEASRKFQMGQYVCLFVNANMLLHPGKSSITADHWIVLTSPVTINEVRTINPKKPIGRNILMNVFSWGKLNQVWLGEELLLKNFYGYISSSP